MEEFNVAAQIKIYLDDQSAVANVKSAIEGMVKVQKFWEEEVGFGIKVLKANLLLTDSEGGMDQLESKIRSIDHVSEIEVETVTRV